MAIKPLAPNDRPGHSSGAIPRGFSNLPSRGVGITAPPGINHGDQMIGPQVEATNLKTGPRPSSTTGTLPPEVMAIPSMVPLDDPPQARKAIIPPTALPVTQRGSTSIRPVAPPAQTGTRELYPPHDLHPGARTMLPSGPDQPQRGSTVIKPEAPPAQTGCQSLGPDPAANR